MHILALLKCGKIKSQFFLIYRVISCNIEKIRQFNYRKLYLIVCLPTSAASLKKQESGRKTSTFALLTMPKPLTVWITTNCGKLFKRWEYQPPDLPVEKSVCRSGSNSKNWTWNNRLVPNRERSMSRLHIVTLLI